jgi:hypothetical protein
MGRRKTSKRRHPVLPTKRRRGASRWPTAETDVAKPVVDWLKAQGWEVFQEVEFIGNTCDIVARKDKTIWAIEVKCRINLEVLYQANRWLPYAQRVSIAVPFRRKTDVTRFAKDVLTWKGIGLLEVSQSRPVTETLPPTERPGAARWRLHEEQKDFCPAGSQHGAWTPFKQTVLNLTAFAKANPGTPLKDAIAKIQHHYKAPTTAVRQIEKYTKNHVITTIRLRDGKVYPAV